MYKLLYILLTWSFSSSLQDDFLLIKNYDNNTYHCITNSSFAITWIGNARELTEEASKFIPNPPPQGFHLKIGPPEENREYYPKQPWVLRRSLSGVKNINKLILDRRWENLRVFKTNSSFKNAFSPSTDNFNVPLSIRAEKETHIFLCDDHAAGCYWFALQVFNKNKTILRKCSQDFTDGIRWIRTGNCTEPLQEISHPADAPHYLSEAQWSHFEIVKTQNHMLLLSEKNQRILEFNATEEVKINLIIIHTGGNFVVGYWKIHEVDYMYTEEESNNIQLGPVINVINKSICISMFVTMCFLCKIKLTLADPSNPKKILKEKTYRPRPGWFEIKFIERGIRLKNVILLISTIDDEKFNKFWAIDEVRQCQEKEFRFLTSSTKANCQLFSGNQNDILSEEKLVQKPTKCAEDTFGKNCLPCSLISSNYCGKMKICERNKKKIECVCSSGYIIPNSTECDAACQPTRYGHNCQKSCGQCFNKTCNHVAGTCSQCIDNYSGPKCDIAPNYLAIVGIVLFLLVAVTVIIVLIIRFVRNKIQKQNLLRAQNIIFHNDKPVEIPHFLNYVKISLENGQLKNQYEIFVNNENKEIYEEIYGNLRIDYIDNDSAKKAYLVTEFPKSKDFEHFWQTVWDENIENIVLIDNIYTGKKLKNYWPAQKHSLNLRNLSVLHESTEYFADYEIRNLAINCNGLQRRIKHLRFVSWGDRDDFGYPLTFVPFFREMSKITMRGKTPILIHSRYGPESANFIILCDMCLRKAAKDGVIDIVNIFQKLNADTSKSVVNSFEDYIMIHLVILENILFLDNEFLDENKVKEQLNYLKETKWLDQIVEVVKVKEVENYFWVVQSKRQDEVLLVPSLSNPTLTSLKPTTVDGFRNRSRFILIYKPTKSSLADFWRLVKEMEVSVIVSLNKGFNFWPSQTEPVLNLLKFLSVKHEISKDFGSYDWITVQLHSDGKTKFKTIDIISFKNWQAKTTCPPNISDFVNFCTESNSLSVKSKKVIVTSAECFKASSLYVAMLYNIEKIKMEGVFDVCTSARSVRRHGIQFGETEEKVKFLFEASKFYAETFFPKNLKNKKK